MDENLEFVLEQVKDAEKARGNVSMDVISDIYYEDGKIIYE
jgi:hypothetical protein